MAEEKIKKIQNIIIVILSILLATSICLGASFAWFNDVQMTTGTITMGGGVHVSVLDLNDGDASKGKITLETPSNKKLVPGMDINFTARAELKSSSTVALLRAKFSFNLTGCSDDTTAAIKDDVLSIINTQIITTLGKNNGSNKWRYSGGWVYYIGSNTVQSDVANTMLQSIDCSSGDVTISLFDNLTVDTSADGLGNILDNKFRNATLSISINFQAIQGVYLVDNDDNTIKNVITGFEEAFSEA